MTSASSGKDEKLVMLTPDTALTAGYIREHITDFRLSVFCSVEGRGGPRSLGRAACANRT